MDMKKTGALLKSLRKEKGLTQEQLAERLNVSARTVSRWETGTNLPDLDLLIILSDFYEVEIRSLIEGEATKRKIETENSETLEKLADYSAEKEKGLIRRIFCLIMFGFAAWVVSLVVMMHFLNNVNDGALVMIFSLIGLLIYGVLVFLVKTNRTVNGYIFGATGAFAALTVSNLLLTAVFFSGGTYTNRGLIGVFYAFGIIIACFLFAIVSVTLINRKNKN